MISINNYENLYADLHLLYPPQELTNNALSFSDAMPALCYAHGISWTQLTGAFPEVFSFDYFYNSVRGPKWPTVENFRSGNFQNINQDIINEINDIARWNWAEMQQESNWIGRSNRHSYSVYDQIDFVNCNKVRTPKGVLEVGGGYGLLGNTFGFMKTPYLGVDIAKNVRNLYDISAKQLFGQDYSSVELLQGCISEQIQNINLSTFDTIVMVESIEHIPEERFDIFWNYVIKQFQGQIIITNWLDLHPIESFGPYHCFEINDRVYDKLSAQAKQCLYRKNSHLILEF